MAAASNPRDDLEAKGPGGPPDDLGGMSLGEGLWGFLPLPWGGDLRDRPQPVYPPEPEQRPAYPEGHKPRRVRKPRPVYPKRGKLSELAENCPN